LLSAHPDHLRQIDEIRNDFPKVMQAELETMWAAKLGLRAFDSALFRELETLMVQTPVDYTIFFRELSMVPDDMGPIKKSFYRETGRAISSVHPTHGTETDGIDKRWSEWFTRWKSLILSAGTADEKADPPRSREEISARMKRVNPKYSLREWLVAPAYQQAAAGNYALVRELQEVLTQPYAEQSKSTEDRYYRLMPSEFIDVGGLSYYSCSS
jgi:uncharacterized protein YdiU (UPF0061 family)